MFDCSYEYSYEIQSLCHPIFIRFASLETRKSVFIVWWDASTGGRPGARAPFPLNPALVIRYERTSYKMFCVVNNKSS
jgi:hypothetical protein